MVAIMQHVATVSSALPSDASALEASISALRNSISALDSSIKTLEDSSSPWEIMAIVSSFVVFFGIVGELVVIVSEDRDDTHDWARGIIRSPDRPPRWRFWFDIVATVIVLAGVWGEAWASKELSSINSQLRSKTSELRADSDQLLSLVTQEAGIANLRAGAADDRASANEKEAESERLARVKIEAAVAFRQLTPQQKEKLGDNLARFKGLVGISFWYQGNDAEAQLFGDDMAEALRAKGAIVQPPANFLLMKESGKYGDPIVGANTGVTVQSTNVGRAPEFALALVKELNDMGFDAKRQTDPPFDKDTTSPLVWVNVDARPKGPQGEYKLQQQASSSKPSANP